MYLATIADSNQSIQTLDMPVSYSFIVLAQNVPFIRNYCAPLLHLFLNGL